MKYGLSIGSVIKKEQIVLEGQVNIDKKKARSAILRRYTAWPECCHVPVKLVRADEQNVWPHPHHNKRYILICARCSDAVWLEHIDRVKDMD